MRTWKQWEWKNKQRQPFEDILQRNYVERSTSFKGKHLRVSLFFNYVVVWRTSCLKEMRKQLPVILNLRIVLESILLLQWKKNIPWLRSWFGSMDWLNLKRDSVNNQKSKNALNSNEQFIYTKLLGLITLITLKI